MRKTNEELAQELIYTCSQDLIDICFAVAMHLHMDHDKHWKSKSREEVAEWVAKQLRECGYDTQPMGMSWGVLK